jgi:hypothetical protein
MSVGCTHRTRPSDGDGGGHWSVAGRDPSTTALTSNDRQVTASLQAILGQRWRNVSH